MPALRSAPPRDYSPSPSSRPRVLARSARVRSPGGLMTAISLKVNQKPVSVDVEPRTLLVELLREQLALTGTHVGCDTSQCGACVVMVDGRSIKSCTMLAVEADGAEVVTIEGLAQGGKLHPMQQAFHEHHGLQCGFCTPGMVISAVDLLKRNREPT